MKKKVNFVHKYECKTSNFNLKKTETKTENSYSCLKSNSVCTGAHHDFKGSKTTDMARKKKAGFLQVSFLTNEQWG